MITIHIDHTGLGHSWHFADGDHVIQYDSQSPKAFLIVAHELAHCVYNLTYYTFTSGIKRFEVEAETWHKVMTQWQNMSQSDTAFIAACLTSYMGNLSEEEYRVSLTVLQNYGWNLEQFPDLVAQGRLYLKGAI